MLRRFKNLAASWNPPDTTSPRSTRRNDKPRGAKRRIAQRKRPRLRHCDLEIYESRLLLTFHLWKMDEVFSSADGKVQFIELHDPVDGESHTGGKTISSNENTFTFPANLPTDNTANMHFLIGTQSYAALPGAVQPDYTIPDNFFNPAGDSLDYADVDAFSFTAAQMPTDGVNSLMRNFNTFALSTGPNVETNLSGQTGSVTVPAAKTGYLQVNLVSDQSGAALLQDPNLVNPWGVALPTTGGALWVSDNGAGVSTLYSGDVAGSAFGKVPLTVTIPNGAPTGQVANSTSDFAVSSGSASGPAKFIFASENSDITGWNPTVPAAGSTQAQVAATTPNAVYKGIALANNGTANQLYAANFNSGHIDVFDAGFHPVTLAAGAFTDPNPPAGYAPFNIANIGGQLYVTYALQDAAKHDDIAGFGHGFVDIYDTSGTLIKRLITGHPGTPTDPMDSPWGMAIAPANFGDFSGDLLVGDFGNGKINAFDPNTGTFLGTLSDASGNPIVIDGLWALQFGNATSAGNANTLFFTAGTGGEQHGLLGEIVSAASTPLTGEAAKLTATEATAFSGTVAAFSSSNTSAQAAAFTATIDWGDGSTSVGSVTANGDGGFNVAGNHTYADEAATETIHVTVSDGTNTITLNGSAAVKDAPLTASGVPVSLQQGLALTNVTVATFTDAAPEAAANYTATINWGDGTTDTGTVAASGSGFDVTGSHTYAADGAHAISVTIKDEGGATATATTTALAGYLQVNLVSDLPGNALVTDPNLVNPWGVSFAPSGPFWVSDNGADVATIYSGDVNGSPFSKSGLVVSIPGGAPTGQVANATSDFVVGSGAASGPAKFIFASENGSITGWNPTANATQAQTAVTVPGAVYKGLALANNGTANELFATNFAAGTIDVFDASFHQVTLSAGAFSDPNLPAGFAPFGIELLNGKLFVSYAKQDAAKHDDVAGFGNGFIDEYNLDGTLAMRLVTGTPGDPTSPLNSPWGMAIAPANFGDFSGDLLVGNFGDGKINAFDPNTGTFLGTLSDASGKPIVIDGLWNVVFGNGTAAGSTNTLFFTAGTGGEQHGTFGSLISAENTPLTGDAAKLTATEATAFSGTVAAFASSNTLAQAAAFTATIDWGDGSTSAGTVTSHGDGGFNVAGNHTYADEAATETIHVTVSDGTNTITLSGSAAVKDAPLTASGVPVSLQQGLALTNVTVATFTDAAPEAAANYTATINWGDGTTDTGTVAASGSGFDVTGSHTYATDGQHSITVTIKDEGGATATATTSAQAGYLQVNLVSDRPGNALVTDPNLVNPWGIAFSPTSPFWISDNGADVATIYSGDVNGSPFSKAGLVVSIPAGAPTGQVANATSDFVVGSGTASGPAKFIFASENGSIAGWNPTANPTQAQTAVTVPGAVYKGLALGNNGTANELFATNFAAGTIDVFDASFHQVTLPAGAFSDPNLPAGFAPFGIELINGKLFVTYAKQDAAKHDDVAGFGNGFIDEYNLDGTLAMRLVTGTPGDPTSPLNSPWGMAIAPANFGDFSGDLLVGNFGDGKINAFDPNNGAFLGTVSDASGKPIVIDGLWNVVFGNGTAAGSTNTLFFTAGTDGEQHGTFGSLITAENTPLTGDATKLTTTEATAFSGTVAAFSSSNTSAQAAAFTATIDWGDGSTSAGTVTSNGDGGFNVAGNHTYADEAATETIHVTVSDGTNTITLNGSAAVKDAPLTASGVPVSLQRGLALTNVTVATFTEAAPEVAANYTATINWGDGTTDTGTVASSGSSFDVTGSHTFAADGAHAISVTIKDEGGATATATTTATAGYLQVNLVSDLPGNALITDPNLVNPWGIALSPSSPFWISDNGADVATIYSGDVNGSAFSKSGLVVSIPGGAPTGQVANATSDFVVGSGAASGPAKFIFASENGSITGWNPTANATQAQTAVTVPGAVYKGLALANNGTANDLFATNFAAGTIDVFDASFHQVTLSAGAFSDPNLPAGFAPFGIELLNGKLFVSYAKQDAAKHDDVAGFGNGFIDEYNLDGTLAMRLVTGTPGDPTSPLNSPWGMAIAPANFGDFSGDLLVGNFGDGKITAFDPNTGTFLGTLSDASGNPIVIDGLWALAFGNGAAAGSTNTLFFTAGTDGEQHGTFGSLTSAENTPLAGDGAKLTATEGSTLSATIATFSSSDVGALPSAFSTTINWGDGSSSAGTIVANGSGGFNVVGSHKFTEEGTYTLGVAINDANDDNFTMSASVSVADAALNAVGAPINLVQGNTLSNATLATFTDAGGAEPAGNYSATIDWGDGSSSAGTVTASGATFSVAGTHTYTTSGAHTVTTSIKDDGGSTATATSSTSGAGFLRLNLVSDQPGDGLVTDPNLVNPWGIGLAPTTGAFWISDNGADVATPYSGDVAGSPFSKAGLVVSIPGGAPTGQVFNGTSDFVIHSGTASAPALFIFASENGSITGWNPAVPPPPPSTHAQTGVTVPGAVYKGLALGSNGSANELFATNFAAGTIDVFDGSFHQVTLAAGAFTDPNLPAGYAPFGIANLGGKLYVSYALQDSAKHDDVAGFGHGFVNVYDTSGVLLDRLVTGTPGDPNSPLNSPWGMAIAPAGFGGFGGDLLVGNFGDGKINAFDPNTGTFLGTLSDPSGTPLVIDGLWALQFGNGATADDPSTLFFSAGTDGEQHGTFGALIDAQNTPLDGEGTAIAPTEGASFSGAIATFAASNTSTQAGDFSATIDWGDGATGAGTVVANPEGGFNVVGNHTFAEEGTDTIHVSVTDNAGHTITIGAGAKVADAPLTASGTTFTATVDNMTSVLLTVATFTDAGGPEAVGNYTATIDWGDGSSASAGVIAVSGNEFSVQGSHAYLTPGHHTVTVTIKDEGGSTATATSKVVVGNDHERLIEQLFERLLNRAVDAAALNFFVGLLDSGMPASSVVAQIEQSTEFLADEVQTLFQQLLHRAAEVSAVNYFSHLMSAGASFTLVEQFIIESPEYFHVRGTGGTPFLNALFEDGLGRPIDSAAQAFFSKQPLDSVDARAQVVAAVFESEEFLTDLVEHDYQTYLGRPADAAAVSSFVAALAHGLKAEQLVADLLGSAEFAGQI